LYFHIVRVIIDEGILVVKNGGFYGS